MRIKDVYSICSILFQRTENAAWETGLLINEGERIYDENGNEPEITLWDYKRTSQIEAYNVKELDCNPDTKEVFVKLVLKY